jgi:Amt family ammonium transporter
MASYLKLPSLLIFITLLCLCAFLPEGKSIVSTVPINSADTAWMLTATALVLFMTPGLSFFYGGMVGHRNVISTMLQSFVCMGIVSILWVIVGFSLCFGDSIGGIIGDPRTFFMFHNVTGATHAELSPTIPLLLFALFQMKFAIITPALITGSFAERVRFSSYTLFVSLFTVFIYAPLAHMTWHPHGLLRTAGVLDFAGGTVVHMSAGLSALVGAWFLGRRYSHISSEPHRPANIPYVILGTGMLWFGWFGFNAGSALGANALAAQAFATTNTASAAAMLTWLLMDSLRGHKPGALGACIGAVVGLVGVTPAAGFVTIPQSLFIGAVSAMVSHWAVHIKSRSELDDTLDVFPCHGVGGIVGMILTGVFASDGLIHGKTALFSVHLIAMIGISIFCIFMAYLLYWITNAIAPLRVEKEEEILGLDLSQHAETILSGF